MNSYEMGTESESSVSFSGRFKTAFTQQETRSLTTSYGLTLNARML